MRESRAAESSKTSARATPRMRYYRVPSLLRRAAHGFTSVPRTSSRDVKHKFLFIFFLKQKIPKDLSKFRLLTDRIAKSRVPR